VSILDAVCVFFQPARRASLGTVAEFPLREQLLTPRTYVSVSPFFFKRSFVSIFAEFTDDETSLVHCLTPSCAGLCWTVKLVMTYRITFFLCFSSLLLRYEFSRMEVFS